MGQIVIFSRVDVLWWVFAVLLHLSKTLLHGFHVKIFESINLFDIFLLCFALKVEERSIIIRLTIFDVAEYME